MTRSTLSESRVLTPVIAIWTALFVSSFLYLAAVYGNQPRYIDLNSSASYSKEIWSVTALLATSGLGAWLAITWLVLYRKSIVRWLAAPVLISVVALVSTILYANALPRARFEQYVFIPVLISVFGIFSWIAMTLAKQLFSWEIVDDNEVREAKPFRLTIRKIFLLTTLAAVLAAALVFAFQYRDIQATRLWLWPIGLAIPISFGLAVNASLSRFRVSVVCVVSLSIAACAAVLTASLNAVAGRVPTWTEFSEQALLPCLVGYGGTVVLYLAVTAHLWSHGLRFYFGGEAGFAAPPSDERQVRRRLRLATLSVAVLAMGIGGWMYYADWVLMKSPIADAPRVAHLPRLFKIASLSSQSYSSQERQRTANSRQVRAELSIEKLGPEAVPFLLKKSSIEESNKQSQRSFNLAQALLRKLARDKKLGSHEETVVDACVDMLQSGNHSMASSALGLLGEIGSPASEWAIPVMQEYCFEHYRSDPMAALNLSKISQAAALETISQILGDESIELKDRARVAVLLPRLEIDVQTTMPAVLGMLESLSAGELNSQDSLSAMASVLAAVREFGPAAEKAVPTLHQILDANLPLKPDQVASNSGYGGGGYGGSGYDPMVTIRQSAWESGISALVAIQNAEAAPKLREYLQEPNLEASPRQTLVSALATLGPATASDLAQIKIHAFMEPGTEAEIQLKATAIMEMCRLRSADTQQVLVELFGKIAEVLEEPPENSQARVIRNRDGTPLPEEKAVERILSAYLTGVFYLGSLTSDEAKQATTSEYDRYDEIRNRTRTWLITCRDSDPGFGLLAVAVLGQLEAAETRGSGYGGGGYGGGTYIGYDYEGHGSRTTTAQTRTRLPCCYLLTHLRDLSISTTP